MAPVIAKHGAWRSPLTAELITAAHIQLGELSLLRSDGSVWWTEGRPLEKGRVAVVRHDPASGVTRDAAASDLNCRTRVHEYGGGSFVPTVGLPGFAGVSFQSQQLVHVPLELSEPPLELTTPTAGFRFADFNEIVGRQTIVAVREDHRGDPSPSEVVNELVSISLEGDSSEITVLATSRDFYSSPRSSKCGRYLAWVEWDHPNLPWDSTELFVAEFDASGTLKGKRRVAGGPGVSVMQPLFGPSPPSSDAEEERLPPLYFISDQREGWWNLHRCEMDSKGERCEVRCVLARDEESGGPAWRFGARSFDIFDDGSVAVISGCKELVLLLPTGEVASTHVAVSALDAGDGGSAPLSLSAVVAAGGSVAEKGRVCYVIAGSPTEPNSVYRWALPPAGGSTTLQSPLATAMDTDTVNTEFFSAPRRIEFPTDGLTKGAPPLTAFANLYLPRNPEFAAPEGELPPLLVKIHGGPTSQARTVCRLDIQFWCSRGFAVADVDYGGSTGFGREYRERLKGRWGEVDVADCCAVAEYLTREGIVDGAKLAIDGGSAGGFTTLACLTMRDTFSAGTSLYGVADLEALARDTHKFESRYLDKLVGTLPKDKAVFDARSPIKHVDGLNCPLLLLQGDEDKIVPLNQAESMYEAVRANGMPCALKVFTGEQHGFRKAENIKAALELELAWYGRIFGFVPVDILAQNMEFD